MEVVMPTFLGIVGAKESISVFEIINYASGGHSNYDDTPVFAVLCG